MYGIDEGRLASSVRADDPHQLAVTDGDVDAVVRGHTTEAHGDAVGLQQVGHADTSGARVAGAAGAGGRWRWPRRSGATTWASAWAIPSGSTMSVTPRSPPPPTPPQAPRFRPGPQPPTHRPP